VATWEFGGYAGEKEIRARATGESLGPEGVHLTPNLRIPPAAESPTS